MTVLPPAAIVAAQLDLFGEVEQRESDAEALRRYLREGAAS